MILRVFRYNLIQCFASRSIGRLIFIYHQYPPDNEYIADSNENRAFNVYDLPRDIYIRKIHSCLKTAVTNKSFLDSELDVNEDESSLISASMTKFFNQEAKFRRQLKESNSSKRVNPSDVLNQNPDLFFTTSEL